MLDHARIKGTPFKLHTLGVFEVECRTFVVTREGDVTVLKKTGRSAHSQTVFYIRSLPIAVTYSLNQVSTGSQCPVFDPRSWCSPPRTSDCCSTACVASV